MYGIIDTGRFTDLTAQTRRKGVSDGTHQVLCHNHARCHHPQFWGGSGNLSEIQGSGAAALALDDPV